MDRPRQMQNHGAGTVLSARRYRCPTGAADFRDLSGEACMPRLCPRKRVESRCVGWHIRAGASAYAALTTRPTAPDAGDLLGNRCAGPTHQARGVSRTIRQLTTRATRATKLKSSRGPIYGGETYSSASLPATIADSRHDATSCDRPAGVSPMLWHSFDRSCLPLGEGRYDLPWIGTRGVVGACWWSAL